MRWVAAVPDARRLVGARALRGFADGLTSVVLASHLSSLGFAPLEVGAIATATLLGSAALTLAVGLVAHRLAERVVLLAATAVMAGTGLAFAGLTAFWPLLLVAFLGTLNPSAGDVSVFLPTEQSLLAASAPASRRTALFARYNLAGAMLGALGALASGLVDPAARWLGVERATALRGAFLVYATTALALAPLYLRLELGHTPVTSEPGRVLARSRGVVLRLASLFSLDAFGGGFVVDSLVALWLLRRFDLSLEATGAVFFGARMLAAGSQLLAAPLAARIGLVRTMVYTHVPANLLLVAAAFAPTAGLAIACLLARMAFATMDVPARQSLVMALVPPAERAAAASVTNVPRSLAAALPPLVAGALLERTHVGWPLVLGGAIKLAYDLLLLAQFRAVPSVPEGGPGAREA